MSVKIQVLDSSNRPVDYARVIVGWEGGGTSDRRTNNSGIAETDCSPATARYIEVNGKMVSGTMYLSDGVTPVYI